jgi:16S rRNA (guanine966-N2)-methyltransferase
MRVIAGEFRGRTLVTVADSSVRPATDRVRQTLFDVLTTRMDFDGASVLDLFAGSGSLGIEALSRGARSAVFVEAGREAARKIEHNLATLRCEDRGRVVVMDAFAFARGAHIPYDLVFADPPYAFEGTAGIPDRLFAGGLVAPEGFLLIEHTNSLTFTDTDLYRVGPVKKFGRTVVTFFRPRPSPPGPPPEDLPS